MVKLNELPLFGFIAWDRKKKLHLSWEVLNQILYLDSLVPPTKIIKNDMKQVLM